MENRFKVLECIKQSKADSKTYSLYYVKNRTKTFWSIF